MENIFNQQRYVSIIGQFLSTNLVSQENDCYNVGLDLYPQRPAIDFATEWLTRQRQ